MRMFAGWHRLARFGAYRCALAQEVCRDKPLVAETSFGYAAPVAQSGNRGVAPVGSLWSLPVCLGTRGLP